jgi:hypothetical protein
MFMVLKNIKQLENAYEMNKRKRKRADPDFDYIYGIVTTGQVWHFLLYTPENILKGSKSPHIFTDDALDKDSEEYQTLCKSVQKVLSIIVGLLIDRTRDDEPERKRTRVEGYRMKK